jgi:hypothetical protein
MATMVFEAFTWTVAGLIAVWFHRENIRADVSGKILEGHETFRYTT